MRACFLGQNICVLGYGVATLQAPPLPDDDTDKSTVRADPAAGLARIDAKEFAPVQEFMGDASCAMRH